MMYHETWQEKLAAKIEAMPKSERMMLLLKRISECSSIPEEKIHSKDLLHELMEQGFVRYRTDFPRFMGDVELTAGGHDAILWSLEGVK